MNDKTVTIVGSLVREFIYRTVLAYVLLHLMAFFMPMTARADSHDTRRLAGVEQAASSLQDVRFGHAMEHYEANHWQSAFEQFSALADEGHGRSARMALEMWRNGPTLFGQTFAAGTYQRRHWLAVWHNTHEQPESSPIASVR
jgi:hypothetical protein